MESPKILHERLKWIEEKQSEVPKPQIDEFIISDATVKDRIKRKLGENILVPFGLIATTACLTMGLVNMKRGDSKKQQIYMRGRVLFQGLTLFAMVMGITLTARRRQRAQSAMEESPSKSTT